ELVDGAVGADGALWYLIQGVDFKYNNGAVHRVAWSPPIGAGVLPDLSTGVQLGRARPNPARGETAVEWSLPAPSMVDLSIHDLAGRRVATLERGSRAPGTHRSRWNGRDDAGRRLAAGIYVMRLQAGEITRTH